MSRRISPSGGSSLPARVDLVVVGAGVVGLAHAVEAAALGSSVLVVERDARAGGSSVRSFGHLGVTMQDGIALSYALTSRERWLRLGKDAGFPVHETGTVAVARADDERAVLDDFSARRDGDVRILGRKAVIEHTGLTPRNTIGGAFLPLDLRIDQRTAIAAIAAWLNSRRGARVEWSTPVLGLEPGSGLTLVRTARGDVVARRVIWAVGHELDRHFPAVARAAGVQRCHHQMLRVAPAPAARREIGRVGPTVLTGTSMLRHDGFAGSPSARDLRARLARDEPELLAAGLGLMVTQLPDGTLTLGETRTYGPAHDPFRSERLDNLLLTSGSVLLGVPLRVVERWTAQTAQTASAPRPFLIAEPMPGVAAVAATTSNGLTCAFGMAAAALEEIA